jgi:hypothetical protein
VFAAGLLDWLLESLTGKRARLRSAVQALFFASLVVVVAPWQQRGTEMYATAAHGTQWRYRSYIDQIHALMPAPRKGARILLLSEPGGPDDWELYFVMRLYYGDPKLEVQRMILWRIQHVRVDPGSYDYVLDWVGGRFVLVSHISHK